MKEITFKDIQNINNLLQAGEPNNVTTDDYSGFSGYNLQAIVDAVNEVLGFDNWGYDEVSNEFKIDKDNLPYLTVANMKIWLGNKDNYKTAYGQSRMTKGDMGDALKGSQTDAVKKCFSMFSIGNRAYLGLLGRKKPFQKEAPRMPYNQSRISNVSKPTTGGETTNQPEKQKESMPSSSAVDPAFAELLKTESPYKAPEKKYTETVPGKAAMKAFFMNAKRAGFEEEKAKENVKSALKLASFLDITKEQLMNINKQMKEIADKVVENKV